MPALLRAMRPQQWVKNIFVLAALFFHWGATKDPLGNPAELWSTLFALLAFCLGSSSIYLINDVMDVESDRQHPTKCKRPIAAGEISVRTAILTSVACIAAALALAWRASPTDRMVMYVVAGYITLNFFYSLRLKHVVLIDAFCIAGGFLLRVLGGGFALADAEVSKWLLLCTIFLALFLALCKRHAEINLLGEGRGSHRKILLEYTPAMIDQFVTVLAACAIFSYAMYTVDQETADKFQLEDQPLVWTVPFVVFGLFRYMLLVQTEKGGGSPTRVLLGGDGPFLINGLAWLTTVALILFT